MKRKPTVATLEAMGLPALWGMMEAIAYKEHDRHYTIMAFTTGYKVAFGTPNLDNGKGRRQVIGCPISETLNDAIIRAIIAEDTWEEMI
jgi:hypothetical protein